MYERICDKLKTIMPSKPLNDNITHSKLLAYGFVYSEGVYSKVIGLSDRVVCVIENQYSILNNFTRKPVDRWLLTIASIDISNTNSLCKRVYSMSDIVTNISRFDVHHKSVNILLLKFIAIITLIIFICFLLNAYT